MSERAVWSVEIRWYDECTHAGYFSTPEEAHGYADRLKRCAEPRSVSVHRCDLDRPWRELRGAYAVELGPEGEIVKEGWEDYLTPDHQWDGEHGHFWLDGDVRVVTNWGAAVRAVGYDRDEAIERARAMLAKVRIAPRAAHQGGDSER